MSTTSEGQVEYTPSTEEVREEYWLASGDPSRDSKAKPEFDRWLAEHDRAVAAAAWDECVAVFEAKFFGGPTKDMVLSWLDNPYRKDAE